MPAYYCVVQFVPDTVRNERINIGVVAYSKTEKLSQFLQNWRRVKYLGGDEHFLRSVVDDISHMDVTDLTRIVDRWQNCVQITQPAPSLLDAGELLLDASKRFLVDPEITERAYRTKAEVRQRALSELKAAVSAQINRTAVNLLKRDEKLRGRFDSHVFDIAAKNGEVIFAADAISFQIPDAKSLQKTIDATAWAIDDVLKQRNDIPLTVVAAKPEEGNEVFDRAKSIYEGLGAEFVSEDQSQPWAQKMASLVNQNLPQWIRSQTPKE